MFRRGRDPALADVRAVVLDDGACCGEARQAELALLRRIAAEAVILQDDAERLLLEIRDRAPLEELAPPGGALTSRFIALGKALPVSRDPCVRRYAEQLHEILDHHAMMLAVSLDLLAVPRRSERLEDQMDRIAGLGRPAQWLEDLRMDLLVES